jgi:hypothetical protein
MKMNMEDIIYIIEGHTSRVILHTHDGKSEQRLPTYVVATSCGELVGPFLAKLVPTECITDRKMLPQRVSVQ